MYLPMTNTCFLRQSQIQSFHKISVSKFNKMQYTEYSKIRAFHSRICQIQGSI